MKKYILPMILLMIFIPFVVNAKTITAVEYIKNIAGNADKNLTIKIPNTDLAYDNTIDNNLRYIGKNPNNYILFNKELWRIVGVMNNVTDYNGNKTSLLKIVRSEPIDMIPVCNISNNCIWQESILMDALENYYYNRKEYNSISDDTNITYYYDFMPNGIDIEYRDYIEKIKWNIGAVEIIKTPKENYEYEHNTDQLNDNIWYGKVGLISASDYGFAQFPENEEKHNNCLKSSMFDWDSTCSTNNYLYSDNTWVLSRRNTLTGMGIYNGLLNMVNNSLGNGPYWTAFQHEGRNVFPSVYLKSNTIITSGEGTKDEPYRIVNIIKENNLILYLSDKKSITDIFSELINFENVNFKIANNEILKIDKGIFIPLQAGDTDVEFDNGGVHYLLHISILNQDTINMPETLKNPNTGNGISIIIIIIMLIISSITYIVFKRKIIFKII